MGFSTHNPLPTHRNELIASNLIASAESKSIEWKSKRDHRSLPYLTSCIGHMSEAASFYGALTFVVYNYMFHIQRVMVIIIGNQILKQITIIESISFCRGTIQCNPKPMKSSAHGAGVAANAFNHWHKMVSGAANAYFSIYIFWGGWLDLWIRHWIWPFGFIVFCYQRSAPNHFVFCRSFKKTIK